MDTIAILAIGSIILVAIAGLLLYSTRKTPAKKLDKQESLPAKEEFSTELKLPEPEIIQEYVPEPPEEYGDNKIRALVRDPNWVHLHWELNEDHSNDIKSAPILRVYDVGADGLGKLFDAKIDDTARRWDLKVPENTNIVVDLARVYPDGKVVTVLRSNPVTTPPLYMSDKVDEQWMLVDDMQKKLYRRINIGNGPSSPDFYNPVKD